MNIKKLFIKKKEIVPTDRGSMQFDVSQIKLLVGLGNIGDSYKNNRHNAGFVLLGVLSDEFLMEKKFRGSVGKLKTHNSKLMTFKPTTMMNKSGEAVRLVSDFYKIKPSEIAVAHDDLDLQLGEYKIQLGKGPKVHNGINSITKHLGTEDYWRIRIGVDNRPVELRSAINPSNYVLSDFMANEAKALADVINSIKNVIIST